MTHSLKMMAWLLLMFSLGAENTSPPDESGLTSNPDVVSVFTVDGEPVDQRELALMMVHLKSDVIRSFRQNHQLEFGENFWNTAVDGRTPIGKLRENAMRRLIRSKIIQMFLREKGFLDNIRYSEFRKEWDAENERRAKAKANGEVIYGPVYLQEVVYYEKRVKNALMKYRWSLEDQHTEQVELESYYRDFRESYKLLDEMGYHYLQLKKPVSEWNRHESEWVDSVFRDLDLKSLVKVVENYGTPGEGFEFKLESSTFDPNDRANVESGIEHWLLNHGNEIEGVPGAKKIVFQDRMMIIQIVDRHDLGYFSLEAHKAAIRKDYVNHKIEKMIDKKVEDARVVVTQDYYGTRIEL